MKLFFVSLIILLAPASYLKAQDFNQKLASAQSAYSSGNLSDAHFSMQQMMQELDMTIGKEVLKLLPPSLDKLNAKAEADNVSGASGFVGVLINRTYAAGDQNAQVDLITNSPLITSVSALLSLPLIANAADGKQKVIKIHGYKALLVKSDETAKAAYEIQLPFGTTLLTFKTEGIDESQTLKLAEALPVASIIKLVE
jgi:hypothetical protein